MSDIKASVARYSPVLVLDADAAAAADLVRQLGERGCPADVAISYAAARAAAHSRHYRSMVFVADLNRGIDLACLDGLRRTLPSTWIIVIGADAALDPKNAIVRRCADALLVRPVSMDDLMFRVSAFSHRPRPP
jgi:DNA-binding response OmpR family regulator